MEPTVSHPLTRYNVISVNDKVSKLRYWVGLILSGSFCSLIFCKGCVVNFICCFSYVLILNMLNYDCKAPLDHWSTGKLFLEIQRTNYTVLHKTLQHGKIQFLVPIFFDIKVKLIKILEYLINCTIGFNQHVLYGIAIIIYQNYIMENLLFSKSNFLPIMPCFKVLLRYQGAFDREPSISHVSTFRAKLFGRI